MKQVTKHFCDRCGNELVTGKWEQVTIKLKVNLGYELCMPCIEALTVEIKEFVHGAGEEER